MRKRLFLILAIFLIVLSFQVNAAVDQVISNSADWRDVYSTMLYANLIKAPGNFLVSNNHAALLLYSISKDKQGTQIISSTKVPYVVGYKALMEGQGYKNVEEFTYASANLELAKLLTDITKYIIVDDAYGYNSLSVASYAVIDNYYVIFANENNIAQVEAFLNIRKVDKMILYGQLDATVKTRLAKYNPEVINLGDRFDNNIEIVKKYQALKHSKQVVMTNGEFIETSIMSGSDPVLFIGRANVPDQTKEYMKNSEFEVAVLIGNELVGVATNIRRQIGISVFVKFAQSARAPTGTISQVEDLDKFYMPRYNLNLSIYSIVYNKATKALEVTYKNNVNLGTYLKGTITITVNGQTIVVGETDAVFIDKNQFKTFTYETNIEGENISAHVYTLYGESKKALENVLEGYFNVQTITVLDDSKLNITNVEYDKGKGRFLVTVKNIGNVDTYVNVEIQDLFINGEYITVASADTPLLKPGRYATLPVDVKLSDADITNNQKVKVKAYYGERKNSLIKSVYAEFEFKFKGVDVVYYALIALIIILVLLILFARKKCPNCGTKNSRARKKCKKCGHNLYSKVHHHAE